MPNGFEEAWPDIQGNILRPYAHPHARFAIARIDEAAGARRMLASLLEQGLITTAAPWAPGEKPDVTLNAHFSWHGLRAIGLSAASLNSFPEEFRQGMAARRDRLGDPDPAGWEFGSDAEQSHVFFAIYGSTPKDVEERLAKLRAEFALVPGAVTVTHRQDAAMLDPRGDPPRRTEHFGFADGFGQPQIDGSGAPEYRGDGTPDGAGGWRPVATGEFILGWKNETGHEGPKLVPETLSKNGSFMAYRKLEQDVATFRTFLREEAARLFGSDASENIERLAAKIVGRWRSGCPLTLSPDHDNPAMHDQWGVNNDFRYAADPRGAVCPRGSHIRRMNPRDGLPENVAVLPQTHRIVRRGMPYGPWLEDGQPDDGVKRGIAFMAVNSSLAYQFEFVQQEWANNGQFAGLDQQDIDPFTGQPRNPSRFTIPQTSPVSKRIVGLPQFATLRGGGYFFIPSITALRLIAGGQT
jgi:Dyp-type peroxidase family